MVKDKKKKEKKEKKKKAVSHQMEARTYFPEALLAYQVQIKEEIIDQLLAEIKHLEEKNERYQERNQHLKAEQIGHIRALLTALKEQEKELEKVDQITRDDVETAMKDKWQFIKDQERLIKDMRFQMHYFEQRLLQKQAEMDYWMEYKNVGSGEHAKQIECLEQDIQKLKQELEEMTEYFRIALEETKEKIDKYTLKQMELKKEWATENAVKHIDKVSCREIKEYEWLKEEVAAYRKEVNYLETAVHDLERENIYLIKKLMDRRLQHLKVPRTLFLTQGAGLQIPTSPKEEGAKEDEDAVDTAAELILTIERKPSPEPSEESKEEEEQELKDNYEVICLRRESTIPPLPSILYEDSEDFKEYQELGELQSKLMSIVGQPMPIHQDIKEMPSNTQIEERYDTRPGHHITYRMIKSVFP
ncbi:hypothetical protein lerEdw1_005843 [Lerista edwardsae]|nr:hypothetical protein lerEdw1_005843 [Lerista edwardsae]